MNQLMYQEVDKNGFPFTLHNEEKDATMYCPDEPTRNDWVQTVATFCLLEMVSQNTQFNADRLRGWCLDSLYE